MLNVHPGRIRFGSVKCSPPGSARPLFASQPAVQFAPEPVTRSSMSHSVSPGWTRTSFAPAGAGVPCVVAAVASAGSVSTVPGVISLSGPIAAGLSLTISGYRIGSPRWSSAIFHRVSRCCT